MTALDIHPSYVGLRRRAWSNVLDHPDNFLTVLPSCSLSLVSELGFDSMENNMHSHFPVAYTTVDPMWTSQALSLYLPLSLLSVYLSVCLSASLCVCLSVCLSFFHNLKYNTSEYFSTLQFVPLSLYVCLSVSTSISICMCVSIQKGNNNKNSSSSNNNNNKSSIIQKVF